MLERKLSILENNPSDYKVCKMCSRINVNGLVKCHNCGHKNFNPEAKSEIARLRTRYNPAMGPDDDVSELCITVG